MKVYIAGPMSGYKDLNYPAFFKARIKLRELGHEAISPTVLTEDQILPPSEVQPREFYVRGCIKLLMECDAIHLLEGWQKSRGASLEYDIASQLEMQVIELDSKEQHG